MKKILLLLVLILSLSMADSALLVKKGWSLIGSTSKIVNMSIFDSKNVERVWHFDAVTQKWLGFSPESSIQKKMTDKGYKTITSLESWHGFWIKSKHEWALTFPTDTVKSDENITLKKGWNLISLPINSVVSPHIFDGKTVWKYAKNNQWEYFEKEIKEDFPVISHISNSDGIWVKSDKDQSIFTATGASKLHNFSTEEEMKSYIKDMLLTHDRPICGYYPMVMRMGGDLANIGAVMDGAAEKDSLPQAADDTSSTNLQEKGVDESDIIKDDNTTIFYVSKNPQNWEESFINITTFENIANNILDPIDKIIIKSSVDSLYLVDGHLVVLSRYAYNYKSLEPTPLEKRDNSYNGDISSIFVDIFNVSNISDIQKTGSFKINGQLNNSRVVDGKLFLITNFYPYVRKTYPKIYIDATECKEFFFANYTDAVSSPQDESKPYYEEYKKYARCYGLNVDKDNKFYRYDYDNPKITYERLIPFIQKNSEQEQELITPSTFFAPNKKDQDATITTVSKIDIETASLEKTSSVLGYSSTVYASAKALYLVSNKYPIFYNFDRYEERSAVYKFLLDESLGYKASGFVNGRVLNQFSLSEYEDILRIATTEGNSWQGDTKNSIFTLSQHDDSLLIDGALSGLGKEGELIQSVRFIGDRGYVVTFKQTDPFYTIDLSDVNNPVKAGELAIEGYSSYLHPIDKNHILGIGRDATSDGQVRGLKLELFNVENFSQPTSVSRYSFGTPYSYSEMERNHKALAYRDSDKLLGFAYSTYLTNRINNLGVFQIQNDAINAYKPISSPNSDQNYDAFERGLIFDFGGQTYVAYFANGKIAYSLLNNLK